MPMPYTVEERAIGSIGTINARILDREQNWYRRKIKESLYIRGRKNFNN